MADVGMGQKHGQPIERDVLGGLESLELRWKVGGRLEDGPDAFTVRVGVCHSQAHNFPVRRRPQKQVAAARPVASDVGRTPVLKGSQHLQHRPIGSVCLAFSSSVKTSRQAESQQRENDHDLRAMHGAENTKLMVVCDNPAHLTVPKI